MMTDLDKYKPIAEAIVKLLYPFAEVVIHDMRINKIAAIYNAFSKRSEGDSSDIKNFEAIAKGSDINGPFIDDRFYGCQVRFISIVLKDNECKAIGLFCINIDIKEFQNLQNVLALFLKKKPRSSEFDKLFNFDWQDRIHTFIQGFLKEKNRSLTNLTKQEKIELVHSLRDVGGFQVANAIGFTANILGVSRATIYNYLNNSETKET